MTAPATHSPAELASRTSHGITVRLLWNKDTDRVTLSVCDAGAHEAFELDIDHRHALEAFNHPYAYAARTRARRTSIPVDPLAA